MQSSWGSFIKVRPTTGLPSLILFKLWQILLLQSFEMKNKQNHNFNSQFYCSFMAWIWSSIITYLYKMLDNEISCTVLRCYIIYVSLCIFLGQHLSDSRRSDASGFAVKNSTVRALTTSRVSRFPTFQFIWWRYRKLRQTESGFMSRITTLGPMLACLACSSNDIIGECYRSFYELLLPFC